MIFKLLRQTYIIKMGCTASSAEINSLNRDDIQILKVSEDLYMGQTKEGVICRTPRSEIILPGEEDNYSLTKERGYTIVSVSKSIIKAMIKLTETKIKNITESVQKLEGKLKNEKVKPKDEERLGELRLVLQDFTVILDIFTNKTLQKIRRKPTKMPTKMLSRADLTRKMTKEELKQKHMLPEYMVHHCLKFYSYGRDALYARDSKEKQKRKIKLYMDNQCDRDCLEQIITKAGPRMLPDTDTICLYRCTDSDLHFVEEFMVRNFPTEVQQFSFSYKSGIHSSISLFWSGLSTIAPNIMKYLHLGHFKMEKENFEKVLNTFRQVKRLEFAF